MKIVERSRKIKPSPVHIITKIPSEKNGACVATMSRNERNMARKLESMNSVARYDCQPFTCLFDMDDEERCYTPDFTVYFRDDTAPLVLEVKPAQFLEDRYLQRKLVLVAHELPKLGYRFMIMTEKHIPTRTEYFNLRFLYSHRERLPSEGIIGEVLDLVKTGFNRTFPLDEYIRRHDNPQSSAYALIANGYLFADMTLPIDYQSQVSIAGVA